MPSLVSGDALQCSIPLVDVRAAFDGGLAVWRQNDTVICYDRWGFSVSTAPVFNPAAQT